MTVRQIDRARFKSVIDMITMARIEAGIMNDISATDIDRDEATTRYVNLSDEIVSTLGALADDGIIAKIERSLS